MKAEVVSKCKLQTWDQVIITSEVNSSNIIGRRFLPKIGQEVRGKGIRIRVVL